MTTVNQTSVKQAVSDYTATLLRKVIQRILAEPLAFNMDSWERLWRRGHQTVMQIHVDGNRYELEDDAPPCGTTCCIAGHVILSSDKGMRMLKARNAIRFLRAGDLLSDSDGEMFEVNLYELGSPQSVAANLLGIHEDAARRLFYLQDMQCGAGWPEEFAVRYRTTRDAAGRAKIAAERIEYFIRTGW